MNNFLILVFLWLINKEALACAVCGTAIEASRKAFIYSTAILSLAPLAMIGALIYYLFRLNRRQETHENSISTIGDTSLNQDNNEDNNQSK